MSRARRPVAVPDPVAAARLAYDAAKAKGDGKKEADALAAAVEASCRAAVEAGPLARELKIIRRNTHAKLVLT